MSHRAHFFVSYNYFILIFIYGEITIFTEYGIIEIIGNILLMVCLLLCAQYSIQSRVKQGRYFWLAAVLIFFTVIRRELSYLSDLFVPSDFAFLSHSYDWWEDMVLLGIYIIALGFLIYSWRYFWAVLKRTPVWLYLVVAMLATLQYMGEHAIVFPEIFGQMVEELSEDIIYAIAFIYLWTFKLAYFEAQAPSKLGFGVSTDNK
ncbi:hypothetical protein [Psychrobacter frigidicola]|uniref:hypothetical protein n=1 Tax=Psychrobacter frigidicola TaxID=45611 RepID=UPI00191AB3AE|nr:hypothetical protein [Psychrobacter frigidicola]